MYINNMDEQIKLDRALIYNDERIPLVVDFKYYDTITGSLRVSVQIPEDSSLTEIFNGNIIAYIYFNIWDEEIEITEFRNYLSLHDKNWDRQIHDKIPEYMFKYGKGFGRLVLCLGIKFIADKLKEGQKKLTLEAADKKLIPYYENFGFKTNIPNGYKMTANISDVFQNCIKK